MFRLPPISPQSRSSAASDVYKRQDSNLPQALRAHFAFVEDQLNQPDSAGRDRWFRRFLDGELVGSGWTEIGAVKLGEVNTRVTPTEGGWRLDGEKFYSTGALYADWIDVFARRSDTASDVIALVSTCLLYTSPSPRD